MEKETILSGEKLLLKAHDVEVYYEKYEQKGGLDTPILLLIHGFLGSTFTFRVLIPYLTERYNVLSIDLPGFGESEKSKTFKYTLSNYGQLVIDFLNEMNISKVHIIGHSMGGQIGLHVAKRKPHMIDKLVLLGCSAYIKRASRWIRTVSYIPFFRISLRHWLLKKDIRENLREIVYDASLINDEMVNGYRKQFLSPDFYPAFLRFIRYREGDMGTTDLQQIKHHCLLIWGKEDKVVPVRLGYRLHHALPNSTFKVYEKAGHLLPEEIPNEIYDDISSFLR